MEKEKLLTLTEALEKLRVSRRTMYRLIKSGKLTAIRFTPKGIYHFDPLDLDQFINSSKVN